MVGAAGIVASTINNRHVRRESRGGGGGGGVEGSRGNVATTAPGGPPPPYSYTSKGGNNPTTTPPTPDIDLIEETLTLPEKIKFYSSLSLGVVASLCVFALLFLIPLVVDPAISTLLADFDPSPASCVTVDYTLATGLSKCGLWSSCREGCTSTPSSCHQIYVSYRKPGSARAGKKAGGTIKNFTILDSHEWLDESRWDVSYTQLLINAKGCGYPPRVKCEEFGDTYGLQGRTFPCYYSRANPRLVVTDYKFEEAAQPLFLSLLLPLTLFSLSISILSFWYCPSCEERGKNKRPSRAHYRSTRLNDDRREREAVAVAQGRQQGSQYLLPPSSAPTPIVQQPGKRGSGAVQHHKSPSLATISSKDTTVSSVNSMDDGWQSPPSPPPRVQQTQQANRVSNFTRTRKL